MAKIVARVYSEFYWIGCYPCSPEKNCLLLWEVGLERVDSKSVVKLLVSQSKWNHPERVAKKSYTKQFKLSTKSQNKQLKSFRTMICPENRQLHSLGHCNIQPLVTNLRLVGSHLLIFIFESNQLVQLGWRRLKSQPLTCQHFAPLLSLLGIQLAPDKPDDPVSPFMSVSSWILLRALILKTLEKCCARQIYFLA